MEKLYELLKPVLVMLIFLTTMSRNEITVITMGVATMIVFVALVVLEGNLRKRGYFGAKSN